MEADGRMIPMTCLIDMHLSPGDVDRAVQLLPSTVGRTEAKPGYQACSVAPDAAKQTRVRYSESWNSEAAFQRHVQSEEFRPWRHGARAGTADKAWQVRRLRLIM